MSRPRVWQIAGRRGERYPTSGVRYQPKPEDTLIADTSAPEPQASDRLREAERCAVERWRPAPRWYHPAIGRVVITTSLFVTRVMNRLDVEGRENLDAVQSRDGRGLLTFSNHVSLFDDPLLTSN